MAYELTADPMYKMYLKKVKWLQKFISINWFFLNRQKPGHMPLTATLLIFFEKELWFWLIEQCLPSGCQTHYIMYRPNHYDSFLHIRRLKAGQKQCEIHSPPKHFPWTLEREQTALVCYWQAPFRREPKWRERDTERFGYCRRVEESYWPVMQCGRAE